MRHLPRDSAFVRVLRGDGAYWDEQVEMTASVLDAIREQTYVLLKVNRNEAEYPRPVPRPGAAAPAAPAAGSLADFNAFIEE